MESKNLLTEQVQYQIHISFPPEQVNLDLKMNDFEEGCADRGLAGAMSMKLEACIGKFDQISTCNSFIYLIIYFIINCLFSIVFTLSTVE